MYGKHCGITVSIYSGSATNEGMYLSAHGSGIVAGEGGGRIIIIIKNTGKKERAVIIGEKR